MSPSGSPVLFQVPTPGVSRRNLQQFARKLQEHVMDGRRFECLVTSDAELRRLNREFRRKDYPTDVLSFPCVAGLEPALEATLGEIAISYDRAREQSNHLGHTVEQELEILMLHGVLHLIGQDHERDKGEMALSEKRLRKYFDLPVGLIEREPA